MIRRFPEKWVPEGFETKTPQPGMKVISPAGEDSPDWRVFAGYFERPEPTEPVITPRRHRASFRTRAGETGYYIKKLSYRGSPLLKDIIRGFRFKKPWVLRQLQGALSVRDTGVRTVLPTLVMLCSYSPLKQEGLFVTRETPGPTLENSLQADLSWDEKLRLIDRYFEDISRMHRSGIAYGASQPRNVIVSGDELVWCDFDYVKPGARKYLKIKDIRRAVDYTLRAVTEEGESSGEKTGDISELYRKHFNLSPAEEALLISRLRRKQSALDFDRFFRR